MISRLLHTPEGVRDVYGGECAGKLAVLNRISQVFYRYGYEEIETPTFEYFDIFSEERGSVSSREMFKFFDRDNRTLVLRPDMTPPIARCVAKYFMDESLPVRLCYRERTFINNSSLQGRLKEMTQTGAELVGDGSVFADAEMVAMAIQALQAAGLTRFQVELGNAEFFEGLVQEAGLDRETREALRTFIEQKNVFGAEELLSGLPVPEPLKRLLLKLPELFGSIEDIEAVQTMTAHAGALGAIRRLRQVHRILESYGLSQYVSYDLGMLSRYDYYTGILFQAYTYGTGDYIATGGRYDGLMAQFGRPAPAVGFAIAADRLLLAMSRQGIEAAPPAAHTLVLWKEEAGDAALRLAMHLRNNGMRTTLMPVSPADTAETWREAAARRGIRSLLFLAGTGERIQFTDTRSGESHFLALSDYLGEGDA